MKLRTVILSAITSLLSLAASAQNSSFNGLDMNLANLSRLSNAQSRSISPENFTGEKGKGATAVPNLPATRNENNASWAARDLGEGWKVNPYIIIDAGQTVTIVDVREVHAVAGGYEILLYGSCLIKR